MGDDDHGHPPTQPLFGGSARADAYSAWAQRLRDKRKSSQDKIRAVQGDGADAAQASEYWSADALFNESRAVEDDERDPGVGSRLPDLLAVFSLEEGATLDDVTRAFRGLAKLHHPDRYGDADEVTQQRHAEQMQRINTAYKALREQMS